nr:unnamed protein product [Digitaria exilis]
MFCSITDDIIQRTFQKRIAGHIWWVNALVLAGGILAGVIVVIGAFRQQYRHHPITRFLFLGATTLFLPIISSVISTVGVQPDYLIPLTSDSSSGSDLSALGAICRPTHSAALIVWAFIVQIVMINTSTVVSVEDREGQSKGPPFELLVQGLWTLYLGVSLIKQYPHQFSVKDLLFDSVLPFGLLFAKLTLKYYAFEKARKSFALGRNPGLVFVYMLQLRARVANQNCERRISEEASPPQLLLMREDEQQVEQHPCGYAFKDGLGTKYKLVHSGSHETIAFFRSLFLKPSYSSGTSDNKIAATHLSRYCAYLMTWSPDLLPDSSSWSKSLYEEVKKDAERALAEVPADGSLTPEDEYQQVVQVLSVNAKHEVLKNGVKLGEQLVLEMIKAEEAVWKLLADFWSEMILYIAPSDNLKEHSEAIARGGELITLLWALLFHAGIVNRPGED